MLCQKAQHVTRISRPYPSEALTAADLRHCDMQSPYQQFRKRGYAQKPLYINTPGAHFPLTQRRAVIHVCIIKIRLH